ncbi:MAG TPA: MFS transporter [Candidatus Methylomirabilis sp.]|jgi:MFS family permease|nr:MFS transporter [Candidatus Methylomirabilis sp.]
MQHALWWRARAAHGERRPGERGPARTLAVSFLTLAVAYGLSYTFPIFYVALLSEFGGLRGPTAAIYSLHMLVGGAISPLIGTCMDRSGPRILLPVGAILLAGGLLLSAAARDLTDLAFTFGILVALGVGCVGSVPQSTLLAQAFPRTRGAAIGMAFAGVGLGVFLLSPLAQALIAALTWRGAFVALAVLAAVLLLPLTTVLLPRPGALRAPGSATATVMAETAGGWTLREALRTRTLWYLLLVFFLTPVGMFAVTTHQVVYAVDRGYGQLMAVAIFGIVGGLSSVGRFGFGALSDRFGRAATGILTYALTALGILALLFAPGPPVLWPLYAYALLFGLTFGARGPIISALTAELYRGHSYGAIFGVISVGQGLGMALGPWLGGAVFDATGSYRAAFGLAVACTVVAAAFLARVGTHLPAPAPAPGTSSPARETT